MVERVNEKRATLLATSAENTRNLRYFMRKHGVDNDCPTAVILAVLAIEVLLV